MGGNRSQGIEVTSAELLSLCGDDVVVALSLVDANDAFDVVSLAGLETTLFFDPAEDGFLVPLVTSDAFPVGKRAPIAPLQLQSTDFFALVIRDKPVVVTPTMTVKIEPNGFLDRFQLFIPDGFVDELVVKIVDVVENPLDGVLLEGTDFENDHIVPFVVFGDRVTVEENADEVIARAKIDFCELSLMTTQAVGEDGVAVGHPASNSVRERSTEIVSLHESLPFRAIALSVIDDR